MSNVSKTILWPILAAFLSLAVNCSLSRLPEPPERPFETEKEIEPEVVEEEVSGEEESRLLLEIEQKFSREEFPKVKELLSVYSERFSEGEHRDRFLFLKGNLFFEQEKYESAVSVYNELNGRFHEFPDRDKALLRLGISYFFIDEWDNSIDIFETLLTSVTLSRDLVFFANRFYARALTNKARFTDAVSAYAKAYITIDDPEKKSVIELEVKDLINNLINWEEELKTTAEILANLPGEADALYKLARVESGNQDYTAAFFTLKRLLGNFPEFRWRDEVEIFLEEINRRRGKHIIKIGCFVPLTGERSFIGRKILNGLQLAFAEVERDEGIKLIVKDSAAGGETLLAATRDFSEDDDVLAVIGPTFSEKIENIIEVAEESGLVLFTPTAASPYLEGRSPYLLRNSITSKSEAFFMARVATDYMGLSSIAILYQDDSGGVDLKNFFREKIVDLGGEITEEVSFKHDQSDFGRQIRAIGGMSDGRIKKILKEGATLEDFRYDAIYIAGNPETVALILPQLAYYNINNIPVLGASSLNSPKFIKSGNLYSKKLIFPAGFYSDSEEEAVKSFTAKYRVYFNEKPGAVSAQAYDTAKILIDLIRRGFLTREALRNSISSLKNYSGITGVISFTQSGDAEREFHLLSVKNGKIVGLDLKEL